MRVVRYIVAFSLLAIVCVAQAPREGPWPHPSRPPNLWEVERPAARSQRHIDLVQVKSQADEMAQLASRVSGDVSSLKSGLLSKNLNDNLKRIEKLSKQLRQELAQ
jgi:hypothetical protein